MKTIQISHDDLDGMTCVMLCREIFASEGAFEYFLLSNPQKLGPLKDFSEPYEPYRLIVTDLGLSGVLLSWLTHNVIFNEMCKEFIVIDHHRETANAKASGLENLEKSFKIVSLPDETSASLGVLRELWPDAPNNINGWVIATDCWDTWKTKNISFEIGTRIALLAKFFGENFLDRTLSLDFPPDELLLLDNIFKAIDCQVAEAIENMIVKDNIGITQISNTDSVSIVCHRILKNYHLDMILLIDRGIVSVRSTPYFPYSQRVAQFFGGGGHVTSAGFKKPSNILMHDLFNQINLILKEEQIK